MNFGVLRATISSRKRSPPLCRINSKVPKNIRVVKCYYFSSRCNKQQNEQKPQEQSQPEETTQPINTNKITAFTTYSTLDIISIKAALKQANRNLDVQVFSSGSGPKKSHRESNCLYFQVNDTNALPRKSDVPAFLTLSSPKSVKDYFYFDEGGIVVGWGITQDAEDQKSFESLLLNADGYVAFSDTLEYEMGTKPGINKENGNIVLAQHKYWDQQLVCSLALARSVKLDEYEGEIDNQYKQALLLPSSPLVSLSEIIEGDDKKKKKNKDKDTMTPRQHWEYILQLQNDLTRYHLCGKPEWLNRQAPFLSDFFNDISSEVLDVQKRAPRLYDQLNIPLKHWKIVDRENQVAGVTKLMRLILAALVVVIILLLLDKSQKWKKFRVEDLLQRESQAEQLKVPPGYEIVEEVIEVVIPKNQQNKDK